MEAMQIAIQPTIFARRDRMRIIKPSRAATLATQAAG